MPTINQQHDGNFRHDKEFHLAIGRNALLKAKILSIFFGVILILQTVIYTVLTLYDAPIIRFIPLEKTFFLPIFFILFFVIQLASYFKIRKALKSGNEFSLRTGYLVCFMEASFPSLLIFLIGKYFPQEALVSRDIIIGGPPVFLYIFLIILSALHLELKISIFMGAVAAAEYIFLLFYLMGENTVGIDVPLIVFRGVAFLVCGIIAGIVSMKIKESILSSLKAKNDLIYNLDKMVSEQTREIREQKEEIELKNKEIMDSINYAQKIQQAILPPTDLIFQTLKDSFILYKPKDIVSGDFYFFAQREDTVLIGACDCTGHGVPGAFMSMIGHDQLNQIVIERGITEPSLVLKELNKGIRQALKQTGGDDETRDGMDIALLCLTLNPSPLERDLKSPLPSGGVGGGLLQYAGANRPLILFRNGNLEEIKPDKTSIGGHTTDNFAFQQHHFELKKGNTIYLFTDGYADQFGGNDGKKFTTKKFKELLASIQNLSMNEQEKILNEKLKMWKADSEQVDDVLVIGVRI